MNLFYTFRIHLGALAAMVCFGLLGVIIVKEGTYVSVLNPFLKYILLGSFWAFFLSWLWLLVLSWGMLLRSWKTRAAGENTKLFIVLFFFNFFGAYYFYWKRFEIDPKVL